MEQMPGNAGFRAIPSMEDVARDPGVYKDLTLTARKKRLVAARFGPNIPADE
jgi:hypothetical protein